jgi:hypothetical protein
VVASRWSEPLGSSRAEVSRGSDVRVGVVSEQIELLFEVVTSARGHVGAVLECAGPPGDELVFLAGVEDGEARRDRGNPVAGLSLAYGGVEDAVLGRREAVKGRAARETSGGTSVSNGRASGASGASLPARSVRMAWVKPVPTLPT